MFIIAGIVIALLILAALATTAANKKANPSGKYRLRPAVLSDAEIVFDTVLRRAIPELIICPKMRVADVLSAEKAFGADFLRISQKHLDWILCDPRTYAPLIAIELDDSSHLRSSRTRKSDAIKNAAASSAGLKLLRVKWCASYDVHSIRDQIAAVINA